MGYLEHNQDALVPYAARRRRGKAISTAFAESAVKAESAVNEIVAKRRTEKQQMCWDRATVQPFLNVRTAVLNDTVEDAFRRRYPSFRPAADNQAPRAAAWPPTPAATPVRRPPCTVASSHGWHLYVGAARSDCAGAGARPAGA